MSSLFISVGHGVRPNGTFDPGAVHTVTGALEYDGNRDLATHVTSLLRQAGHQVVSEADAPYKTDTDYQGSVDAVNAGNYWLAVDFHQDWEQGSQALCWPLIHPNGQESRRVANLVVDTVDAAGLTFAGPTPRTDLWWLNGTNCAAILIEAGRVGTPRPVPELAEAIATGIDLAANDPSLPEGELPPTTPPGAPPGDSTIPPAGQHPAWPGAYLQDYTAGHGTATWQAQMAKRGWSITVDDQFGPQSAAVATSFQSEKGLGMDGVVGPETWNGAFTIPVT
jgi:peptidoglycan hydrolase-like protein with peptidoglycan-binding domain